MSSIGLSKPSEQIVFLKPEVGDVAPLTAELKALTDTDRDYMMVAFLRHTGCPFAEVTVRDLREQLSDFDQLGCIIITHGDRTITEHWLKEIGGLGDLGWYHDGSRALYGRWGLGYSNVRHMLGMPVFKDLIRLWQKGIRNRAASGTRWQRSGTFLLDAEGRVIWVHQNPTANTVPSLFEACSSTTNSDSQTKGLGNC